jgi:hypothetical protein
MMPAPGGRGQPAAAAAVAAAAAAQQQLHAGFGSGAHQAQHGAFTNMSAAAAAAAALGGLGEMSGLELLSRAAQSAGALLAGEEAGAALVGPSAAGSRQARVSRSSDQGVPKVRKPTQTL